MPSPVLLALAAATALASAAPGITHPGRWTTERANEWYSRQPWLVGCNFTPSTAINQLEMWQADTFDPATIDRELGWAAAIGMNSVRVYLHDLLWEQDSEGFLKRIDQFLATADKRGIRTMLVLCDAVWNPHPKLGKQPEPKPHLHNSGWVQSPHIEVLRDPARHDTLEPYFKGVIGRFKDDQRVIAWDLYNEPGNDGKEDKMTTAQKEEKCLLLKNKIAACNWGFVAGKIQTQYPWASWKRKFTAEPELWHHDVLKPDGTPHIQAEIDLIRSLTAPGKE